MFQYAAGKALAAKLNTELLLDISWYKQADKAQTPRNFELTVYPFSEKYSDEKTVNQLIRPSSAGIFNRLKHRLNRSKPIHKQWAFVEPHFHFIPSFLKHEIQCISLVTGNRSSIFCLSRIKFEKSFPSIFRKKSLHLKCFKK